MTNIQVYAPVVITTITRYEHFKRCIDSLSRCTGAENTELFIGVDYPAKESHWKGYNKICEYLPTISGFKEVHIYKREVNYGQSKNSRNLLDIIRKDYDRYISSEDDNEFSPNFLEYINKGLELYKDNPDVVAICGYSYPFSYCKNIKDYSFNAYPIQGFCGWGTGYWFEKRDRIALDFVNNDNAKRIIHSWRIVNKLFKNNLHVTVHRLLFRYEKAFGDLMWHSYCVLNNNYCIYPMFSKVRNHGFDGEGTNCANNPLYNIQEIDGSTTFEYDSFEIKSYKPITSLHNKIYGGTWLIRRLCEIEYILFRLFGFTFKDMFKTYRKKPHLNRS